MSVPSIEVPAVIISWLPATTWAIPLTVLIASVLASPHCIGMCGPIAINFASQRRRLFCYQAGRWIGYSLLGGFAGALGAGALEWTGQRSWLSLLSLALVGLTLVFTGTQIWRERPVHLNFFAWLPNTTLKFWRAQSRLPVPREFLDLVAGALTVFLPCGHLYSFLAAAMATGSFSGGAVFMTAFWLGTVPALGFGAGWFSSTLKLGLQGSRLGQARKWAGVLLILSGLFSLAAFASRLENVSAQKTKTLKNIPSLTAPVCH